MKPTPIDLRRGEPTPLNVVPMTPPVEATLRILLNSVPYLIGAAVVRQPAVGDSVEAQVGRMPWLHDRRLLNLQLPDDTLPANRAILLDWPVPYQAEWVGIPPRLLISRLVARERTVGVLLGTLITREVVTAQAREALDLSCELIAARRSRGTRDLSWLICAHLEHVQWRSVSLAMTMAGECCGQCFATLKSILAGCWSIPTDPRL